MRIKMLAPVSTSRGMTAQGKVYDLPDDEARAQVKAGNAVMAEGETAALEAPVESRAAPEQDPDEAHDAAVESEASEEEAEEEDDEE